MIKISSYNIHKAVGLDRLCRPERIIDVIEEIAPQIAILQEADKRFRDRATAVPLEALHNAGYHPVAFETRPDSIGWHGNAILIQAGAGARVRHHQLVPLPTLEPRGAVMAELEIDGKMLRIVGMHLDLSGLWRRKQIRTILQAVAARKAMPTIMAGDLNEWAPHGGCLPEIARDFRIAHSMPSFHSRRPVARLDRIMVGPELRLIASGTHNSSKAKRASDHLPVWAEVEFR